MFAMTLSGVQQQVSARGFILAPMIREFGRTKTCAALAHLADAGRLTPLRARRLQWLVQAESKLWTANHIIALESFDRLGTLG